MKQLEAASAHQLQLWGERSGVEGGWGGCLTDRRCNHQPRMEQPDDVVTCEGGMEILSAAALALALSGACAQQSCNHANETITHSFPAETAPARPGM